VCFFSRGSQLQISKVKVEDSGVYSCRGRNVIGSSDTASVNVIVRDRGKNVDNVIRSHPIYLGLFILFIPIVFATLLHRRSPAALYVSSGQRVGINRTVIVESLGLQPARRPAVILE
jgi:hypothetical protein